MLQEERVALLTRIDTISGPSRRSRSRTNTRRRAALNIRLCQAAIIFYLPRGTVDRWRGPENWAGSVATELSNLMRIHKAFRIIFRGAARDNARIKAAKEAFRDRSALHVTLGGELTDPVRVRRYLDTERGAW